MIKFSHTHSVAGTIGIGAAFIRGALCTNPWGHRIHSPADFPNGKLHSVLARGSGDIFEQSPEEREWQSKGFLEVRVPKCQTHLFGGEWGRVTITGLAAAQPAELL